MLSIYFKWKAGLSLKSICELRNAQYLKPIELILVIRYYLVKNIYYKEVVIILIE